MKAKHAVGHRLHSRVPSTRALQKLKAHAAERERLQRRPSPPASPTTTSPLKRVGSEPKLSREGSAEGLRKAGSHVNLRRNKSHGEVKKAKGAGAMRRTASHTSVQHQKLQRMSVHFDLGTDGDGEEQDDGWTEASGSASPNLSRSGSVAGASSGRSSAKAASAANSKPPSVAASPTKTRDWTQGPDAHQITSRLLQRVPSHSAAPKMSTISATATTSSSTPLAAPSTSAVSADSGPTTPHTDSHKSPLVSRFKGPASSSGTPASTSPFLQARPSSPASAPARATSMSNLAASGGPDDSSSDDRALAPRARRTSTHYVPPQQSRTQQKLWLQRASSNIESVQLAPAGALGLGLGGLPGLGLGMGMGMGATSPLVGSLGMGYGGGGEGGDPRIRMQCEKTGQGFLVVRRYQDPVARGLRRLRGKGEGRVIPGGGRGAGLSQSLKEGRARGGVAGASGSVEGRAAALRSSFDGVNSEGGSVGSGVGGQDEGVAAILRALWERGGEAGVSTE